MMKLFLAPGACSLAAHIVLEELGEPYQAVTLNLMNGDQRTSEYLAMNPKGRVPYLVTDQGGLSESVAILTFLADKRPDLAARPSPVSSVPAASPTKKPSTPPSAPRA
jgi:glutathione S-transferase